MFPKNGGFVRRINRVQPLCIISIIIPIIIVQRIVADPIY